MENEDMFPRKCSLGREFPLKSVKTFRGLIVNVMRDLHSGLLPCMLSAFSLYQCCNCPWMKAPSACCAVHCIGSRHADLHVMRESPPLQWSVVILRPPLFCCMIILNKLTRNWLAHSNLIGLDSMLPITQLAFWRALYLPDFWSKLSFMVRQRCSLLWLFDEVCSPIFVNRCCSGALSSLLSMS